MNYIIQTWESIEPVDAVESDNCIVSQNLYIAKADNVEHVRNIIREYFDFSDDDETLKTGGRPGHIVRHRPRIIIESVDDFTWVSGLGDMLYLGCLDYNMTVAGRDAFLSGLQHMEIAVPPVNSHRTFPVPSASPTSPQTSAPCSRRISSNIAKAGHQKGVRCDVALALSGNLT
jgi:hypothetical protein